MIICFKDISEKGFCSIILLRSLIPLKISYGRAQTKSKIFTKIYTAYLYGISNQHFDSASKLSSSKSSL